MPRQRPQRPSLQLCRGKWCITYWQDGKRKRISTGTPHENTAKQALADFEKALSSASFAKTVGDTLDYYLTLRRGKVMSMSRLEEACVPLKEGLGHLRLDQVSQASWDDYVATRFRKPNPRSKKPLVIEERVPVAAGTLRREFNVLRAALRAAWKNGDLERVPSFETPEDSAPRSRYLTKVEARKLLDACDTLHIRVFISLAMFTGARRGSILALTWDRVDFTANRIDFQEPGRIQTNKRRAIVPIIASLRKELEEAAKFRRCAYVVEWNGKPVPYGLRHSFAKLCKRAGLDWQPTPHHFKHSVASWFAMEGVPIDQAADWLATDSKTLRKVYRKFDPSYLAGVGSALEL